MYVIDSGTLTASDLVQRPQVSPASVSHAVTFLEQQGMLRREQVSGERRERYAVDDEIWFRSLLAEVQASDAFVAAITRGAEILGPTSPEGACLESSAELLRLIADALRQVMEQWRQILAARNAAG
ncbi:MarR family transcriptional regulator [Streptomyces sp. MUSC 14]|uniref:MarR family transcriptional regulator n=1 Tax=Streptomyces sp. MUSC 14 TaxID=1354889 RepID=UPI00352960BF